jgi:hypothetical protein
MSSCPLWLGQAQNLRIVVAADYQKFLLERLLGSVCVLHSTPSSHILKVRIVDQRKVISILPGTKLIDDTTSVHVPYNYQNSVCDLGPL